MNNTRQYLVVYRFISHEHVAKETAKQQLRNVTSLASTLKLFFFSVFLILSLAVVVMGPRRRVFFSVDLMMVLMVTPEEVTGMFHNPRSLKASLKSSVSEG